MRIVPNAATAVFFCLAFPAFAESGEVYNAETVVPPQCYTRTESRFNPCYVCHQTYKGLERPNQMSDGFLQGDYNFSDAALTNHWRNLFVDRRRQVEKISDAEILSYIAQDNYSDLAPRLRDSGFGGYIPDLAGLQDSADAFDANGFARDGSGWVAFNYKPMPSTFWPTNGSTDDVMIRLPEEYRLNAQGDYSRETYLANLTILEAAIRDVPAVDMPITDESTVGRDLDGDGVIGEASRLRRPEVYVGRASDIPVTPGLYPAGTEFLHSVRYVGVAGDGTIHVPARMKELRYMRKVRFLNGPALLSIYGNEQQEKRDENLPRHSFVGDSGIDNGFGWLVQGFIEDAHGRLRPQSFEETTFCMGCHATIGTTIDQTFAFPRKLPGAAGWGYIDYRGMPDAPSSGERDGEFLTYFKRVGGGDEFRQNEEMRARWFKANGQVDEEKVRAADVYTLTAPSRERALALNKAYRIIVREQSFVHGRDATVAPPENVYRKVDPDAAPPLKPAFRYRWDIRPDWAFSD